MATLYGATGGSVNSNLYTIDPITGVWTSVGAIGRALTGLAFDPTSGILYGATSNNSPTNARSLVTVNPATGAGTLVGGFGLGAITMADIAFKSDGTLYGVGSSGGKLYTINKATGAATLVGSTGQLGSGLGFEIDDADQGYLFSAGSDSGEPFFMLNLATGSGIEIGTIQNGDDFPFSGATVAAASFDDSGVMWLLMNNFGSATDNGLATIDVGGAFLAAAGTGRQNGDALAWQGSVKPDPWFAGFPDFEQDFNSAPVTDAVACSTPLGAVVSTDGASEGPSALKLDPGETDSWVSWHLPWFGGVPLSDTQTIWTSFALYVPDWNDFWDGGNAWTPNVFAYDALTDHSPNGNIDLYLVPTSPTTGDLWFFSTPGGGDITSIPVTPGAWVSVETAYLRKDVGASNQLAVEFWLDNVDQGLVHGSAAGHGVQQLALGDSSWSVGHGLPFYVDNFRASINGRIGPAELSAAFFNGVGSGSDFDACTGDPVSAHPVDDFYDAFESHTLNVAAPGVMENDILPTTVSLNTGPAHGSLILNTDGSFSYTPDPGYLGDDTFVYNGNGGTATVTITVAVRDPRAVFDSGPAFAGAA